MATTDKAAGKRQGRKQVNETIPTIEALYDQCMFLDAYQLCRDLYENIDLLKKQETRNIILFGRLAVRLGNQALAARIFQMAREIAPEDPLVLYYAGRSEQTFRHMLQHLEEIESFPLAAFADDRDKASWLASVALTYAMVRDFETAHRNLAMALELEVEKAWVHCCQAEVLCLEDRWPEALAAAGIAWQLSPGMPQASATYGKVMAKCGRIREAALALHPVALAKQSFETILTAVWYICAVAERSPRDEMRELAHQARVLADRLEALTPLADAEGRSNQARIHIDIAWLLRDFQGMAQQAANIQHPFYQRILENVGANPPGEAHISPYKPVFQKHNTCLPTSVAAVLGRFGADIDDDALAEALTYSGTALWRVADWLEQQGFGVKPFIADGPLARELLRNDLPFVVMVKSVHMYHAMAAVGLDETAGVLLVHDPGYPRLDKMLLAELGKDEAPYGLEALAIVPAGHRQLLDLIPDAASEPIRALIQYNKIRTTVGPTQAAPILDAMNTRMDGHPFTRRLAALHAGLMGQPAAAIKIQEALLQQYPANEHLLQELLGSLYKTGNRRLIRKVLARIVLKKRLPGIRASQTWQYPPAEYVAQYANYAGMVKTGLGQAVQLLWEAIEREPAHAASYHTLADLHTHDGNTRKSILPFRCAATLEIENHHYARAYLDALAKEGRLAEGFAFLKQRTERLGSSVAGGEVWATLIDAHEDYGYPDAAIIAMNDALAMHRDDPYLLSYAVKFWGRMGYKADEARCLADLRQTGHRPLYYSAAQSFQRMSGNWSEALAYCRKWLDEEPHNIGACREYANLWAMARGMDAALAMTRQWMAEHRGNDEFELIYLDYLKELFRRDEQLAVLRTRLKRNPYDTWAWRELAFTLVYVMDLGTYGDPTRLREELDRAVDRCRELCPDLAVVYAIQAETAARDGRHEEAVTLLKKAMRLEPEYGYAYNQAWRNAEKLSEQFRQALFRDMEKAMFRATGFLSLARDLAEMAAECFGSSEAHQIVDRWLRRYPDDPEIIKAKTNLLLDYGQGKSDAEKAVAILAATTPRFPNHPDFKFILSRAYRILQDEENWLTTSREILRQFPLSSIQRRQLSEYYQLHDDGQRAIEVLTEGVRFRPLDGWLRYDLIALYFKTEQKAAAYETLEQSLALIPENIHFRGRVIDLLFDYGDEPMAVSVAKAGTEYYPNGAVLWKSYGDALWRSRVNSDLQAVAAAYQRALSCNPRFWDAADRLAELYAHQNRFEEARDIVTRQQAYHAESAQPMTRLAWIERRAGNKGAAMDQLRGIVKRWPREPWSWHLLLDWIKADENWDLAKTVFKEVHPVMADNPDFVCDQLYLLHKAGVDDPTTRAGWQRLLDDFPENEKIHCLRFDILFEKEQLTEADQVLGAIERYEPDSPYVLARKTALKADQQRFDEAVDSAMALMRLPYDVGDWCRDTAWKAFQDHRQMPRLIGAAVEQWQSGRFIEPACFRMVIGDSEAIWPAPGDLARFLWKWGVPPKLIRQLKRLLPHAMASDDAGGSYTAAILDKLVDYGLRGYLIRFAGRHPEIAGRSTAIWQIIGYALVIGSDRFGDRARAWLSSWREHEGCEFWVVSNYIIAIENSRKIRRPQKWALIMENAAAGVDTLAADHTLQFVICKYCEAALRLGRDDLFLSWAERYANILADEQSGYWRKAGEAHLPWAMLQFRHLLTADPKEVKALSKGFLTGLRRRNLKPWVRPEWKRRVRRIKKQAAAVPRRGTTAPAP